MIVTVLLLKSILIYLGQNYAFGLAVFQSRTAKYTTYVSIVRLQEQSYAENLREVLTTFYNYVPWKEGVQFGIIMLCVICIVYQIWKIKKEKEFEAKSLMISFDHDNAVQRVREFYDDTDQSFHLLEIDSNTLKQRFNKLSKLVNDDSDIASARKEVECTKTSWKVEYEWFQKMKIGQIDQINKVSDEALKAQLTISKGFVGKEMMKMRKILKEDKLSYEEIKADVSRLQKYFSIHKPKRTRAHIGNI